MNAYKESAGNNILLLFTSGVISICSYILLLLALFFTLFSNLPIHYSSLQESSIALNAISIEAIIDEKPTPSPNNKPSLANSPLAGSGIKDMFNRIDSSVPTQNIPMGDNREKVEQNSKEKKLQALQSATQELQNKLNSLSNLTISTDSLQSDGEYDEWYAQIEKMIATQWQQSLLIEEKVQAVVHIRISSNGAFSYRVIKYSQNIAFDDSLKAMLEECVHISFPPNPKGTKEIAITFSNTK